jgi:hypothetical protein
MAIAHHRCVVRVTTLIAGHARKWEFFVYGATAEELDEWENREWVKKMIQRRLPRLTYTDVEVFDYEPKYELPRSTVPIVYTVGRRAPEFV